jgi:hypothetical protein
MQIPEQQTVPLKTFCHLHKPLPKFSNLQKKCSSEKQIYRTGSVPIEFFSFFPPPSEWTKESTNNSNNRPNCPAPQKRFIMTCNYPQGKKKT